MKTHQPDFSTFVIQYSLINLSNETRPTFEEEKRRKKKKKERKRERKKERKKERKTDRKKE